MNSAITALIPQHRRCPGTPRKVPKVPEVHSVSGDILRVLVLEPTQAITLSSVMQPGFEQLVQIIKSLARTTPLKFIRVVMASTDGDVRFIEVEDNPAFRTELQEASRSGLLALGLLGWELAEGSLQAKSMIFPWHKDDKTLRELFWRLCEEGVDSVREELERRKADY